MTVAEWIDLSSGTLADAGISSARLDAELILAHTLRKSRTFLHAHPEDELSLRDREIADARLQLRLDRTPLAYVVGHKEFYGRNFKVTPATLIPRPESEAMITMLKEAIRQNRLPLGEAALKLVDVGTGSGCLGITAKLELPELDVTLLDISRHALTVAETNAKRLEADVDTLRSDLLQNYPFQPDYILANLPYVDSSWPVSPETDREPKEALYASDGGLAVINRLLEEAPGRLAPQGLVFIEADPRQHESVVQKAAAQGFRLTAKNEFILCFQIR
jgi:release factor glutamine methyltransferase